MEFSVFLGRGDFHTLSVIKTITPRSGNIFVRPLGHWVSKGRHTNLLLSFSSWSVLTPQFLLFLGDIRWFTRRSEATPRLSPPT